MLFGPESGERELGLAWWKAKSEKAPLRRGGRSIRKVALPMVPGPCGVGLFQWRWMPLRPIYIRKPRGNYSPSDSLILLVLLFSPCTPLSKDRNALVVVDSVIVSRHFSCQVVLAHSAALLGEFCDSVRVHLTCCWHPFPINQSVDLLPIRVTRLPLCGQDWSTKQTRCRNLSRSRPNICLGKFNL
jgi:hypothetical protein